MIASSQRKYGSPLVMAPWEESGPEYSIPIISQGGPRALFCTLAFFATVAFNLHDLALGPIRASKERCNNGGLLV